MIEDFPHQAELFERTCDLPTWAVFFEQGLGKSRPIIRTAEHLFATNKIAAVIVVAPNGVHRNWVTDELPKHATTTYRAAVFDSSRAGTRAHDSAVASVTTASNTLPWLCATYEGIITERGRDAVLTHVAAKYSSMRKTFTAERPFLLIADETSRVKNPSAKRTKKILALARMAAYVRILNGTPVANSPLDVFAQMKLLDEHYWARHGIASYTAFKARFAVMKEIRIGARHDNIDNVQIVGADREDVEAYEGGGEINGIEVEAGARPSTGRTIQVIVGYRDLDKIHALLEPCSTRLTKESAGLKLPPKLYSRVPFELSKEQRRAYDQLRSQYMVELKLKESPGRKGNEATIAETVSALEPGKLITATLAITRILRLHQIACGYLPDPDNPDAEPLLLTSAGDPRLDILRELVEDTPGQGLIWYRFQLDGHRISELLGKRCVRYDGTITSQTVRAEAIERFKRGDVQFFIGNPAAIGMGVSLPMAKSVIYYSNSFSLVDRLQSEDRAHRLNSTPAPVIYYDVAALQTVDEKIIKALQEKKDIAALVQGDAIREWLQ